jgi:hypothetical protein
MITDGNQQVTGCTVMNINSPKAGIFSDEHNKHLTISVAVGEGILVTMICAICICLAFHKKDVCKPETIGTIELLNV